MFCLRLPGWQPFISAFRHLPFTSVRVGEFSYQIWISRLRGLPRSTRYVSTPASSLWHLKGFGHGFPFRRQLRRQLSLPGLIDSAGTNTTGITACASMDFPLTVKGQRLPEYARFLTISVILILFHDLLFEP